jgi:hypothetical protein
MQCAIKMLTTQYGFHELFTVVYFDGKNGNLFLRMRAMSHTSYAAKFEQMITLCKQTNDLFRWQNLISTWAVQTFKPGDKITK